METKFKSLSIFAFQSKFPDTESCYRHLAELKWADGYSCPICSNNKYCKGIRKYDRQCTRCSHLESPTAGTLFHKMKFSILKAYWIVYYVSTNKKGVSSTELSRKLQLRQKTCWLFKQKVMQAMESSNRHPLEGQVEVEKFELGYRSAPKKAKPKIIVIAIEKKTKGVSRIYAKQISECTRNNFRNFIEKKVSNEANIKVSHKTPLQFLQNEISNLTSKEKDKNGTYFDQMRRVIHGFKSWLSGIHGHAIHLQYYINEYCYRYNRHMMKEEIFEDLLTRMVRHAPAPYKLIVN